ncbi:hypothetical protein ABW19_dt0202679 [Dactylella cylindrospora]|nr:hypothetical protein ABW19_dt0202679 [Dactylella cylindrospora]
MQSDPRIDKLRIEDRKGKILPGSYDWILQDQAFVDWSSGDSGRLLWLKGNPGKGKTMIMIGLANELERQASVASQTPGATLAYYYCESGDPSHNNVASVLRGLLFMLITQCSALIKYLDEVFEQGGIKLFDKSDSNLFYTLRQILLGILGDPGVTDVYLLVDALDECEIGLEALLNLILDTSKLQKVKWLVSSRKSHGIPEALQERCTEVDLENNKQKVEGAVHAFIKDRVAALAKERKYNRELQQKVEVYLGQNAQGTFLWVHLVTKQLKRITPIRVLRKLTEFPMGLEAFYSRMFDRIRIANEDEEARLCFQILAVVLIASRQLHIKELVHMISFSQYLMDCEQDPMAAEVLDYLKELISNCGSFLSIQSDTIHLVHKSAEDFLRMGQRASILFPRGYSGQHCYMLERCLFLLSKRLKKDILEKRLPGILNSQILGEDKNRIQGLRYASLFWADHLGKGTRTCSQAEKVACENIVTEFWTKHLLHWIEVVSLLNCVPSAILLVKKLQHHQWV